MYIGEVIRRAQSYCPSEYDKDEMYLWCDEVSSMLSIEDRNVFLKETLVPDSQGRILLPMNVGFENIISVRVGGRELKKEDLRSMGSIKNCSLPAEITYLKPYSSIRNVEYNGDIVIDKTQSRIIINENLFRKGDSVIFTADNITAELQILETGICSEKYCLYTPQGSLDSFSDADKGRLERIVTEKTVCDAPYDTMYIDYIIAKICMLQRDFETYNQFMTSFNSRLVAYKRWITNQLPQAGGKLKNWW